MFILPWDLFWESSLLNFAPRLMRFAVICLSVHSCLCAYFHSERCLRICPNANSSSHGAPSQAVKLTRQAETEVNAFHISEAVFAGFSCMLLQESCFAWETRRRVETPQQQRFWWAEPPLQEKMQFWLQCCELHLKGSLDSCHGQLISCLFLTSSDLISSISNVWSFI